MKSTVRRTLFVVAILAAPLSSASVLAGDDAPAPAAAKVESAATKAVREAFATRTDAYKEVGAAGADQAKRKEAMAAFSKANDEFVKRFAASDWNAFDPANDVELLQNGLIAVGQKAYWSDGDMKTARSALDTLAKVSPTNVSQLAYSAADVFLSSGDFANAREALTKDAADGDDKTKAGANVLLGDVLAAQGDVDGAQKAWQAAIAAIPAALDPRKDRELMQSKSGAELRIALIGKTAPEVDSKTWLDGEPKALSAMKGSVVIVDFWATWCPPCRKVMPGLNKLYEARKKDGLVVIGVTRTYPNGFLPKRGTSDPLRDGESVKAIKPEEYVDHLKAFKTNVGITYPFVVATDVEPKAYHVSGIPTMALIDRDGKIVFVAVGSDPAAEAMLHAAVDRLLAAPAPAK